MLCTTRPDIRVFSGLSVSAGGCLADGGLGGGGGGLKGSLFFTCKYVLH